MPEGGEVCVCVIYSEGRNGRKGEERRIGRRGRGKEGKYE